MQAFMKAMGLLGSLKVAEEKELFIKLDSACNGWQHIPKDLIYENTVHNRTFYYDKLTRKLVDMVDLPVEDFKYVDVCCLKHVSLLQGVNETQLSKISLDTTITGVWDTEDNFIPEDRFGSLPKVVFTTDIFKTRDIYFKHKVVSPNRGHFFEIPRVYFEFEDTTQSHFDGCVSVNVLGCCDSFSDAPGDLAVLVDLFDPRNDILVAKPDMAYLDTIYGLRLVLERFFATKDYASLDYYTSRELDF